jgi:hypothetical protein
MTHDIKNVEKEAHRLLGELKYLEASELFSQTAAHYQKLSQHKQAALLFASAASCWGLKAGEKALFYHAAALYEKAAQEAESAADFEYASTMYKHAGICYERDLGFVSFAECFYRSKECYRKYLSSTLFSWGKKHGRRNAPQRFDLWEYGKHALSWFNLTSSSVLWGHGERPQRTIIVAVFIIIGSAVWYMQGVLLKENVIIKPTLLQSMYFSVINFTRVGYWDFKPIGFNRGIAAVEAILSGIFIIPIFITGLCRKYLRFI